MMAKKTNPRRVPVRVTEADIRRIKAEATSAAMKKAILLMLYVLVDKHDASKEDLNQFAGEINYAADSVKSGFVNWNDIEKVLLDEYEIELDL